MKRIGFERWKYLDYAGMAFAEQNWTATTGYLKLFLDTIKEDTEEAKLLTAEFDRIESEKHKQIEEMKKNMEHIGWLEKGDLEKSVREQIEMDTLHDRITACWTVSMKKGLFYE